MSSSSRQSRKRSLAIISPVIRKCRVNATPPSSLSRRKGESVNKEDENEPSPEKMNGITEERSMDYGKPPPIEEPDCYSVLCATSESPISGIGARRFDATRETMSRLITEHAKRSGGRTQLLEDMTTGRIGIENAERIFEGCRPFERNALFLQACFLARNELLPILIALGADVNHMEKERGLTGLDLCAYSDSLVGFRLLVSCGAHASPEQVAAALRYAALGNSCAVARYILQEFGTTVEDEENEKETALYAAARANALDVLKLIASMSSAESLNRLDQSSGEAAIHRAADHSGGTACLTALVEAGASMDLRTRKGETALHLAAAAGCAENLEILMKNGADAGARNARGQTGLHLSTRAHSLECVGLLLRSGRCDVNTEDNDGRTPLHLGLGRSVLAYDVTEFLTDWRADVNKPDKYGYTPLHVAALNELSRCVDLLIECGADLSARTKGGTTALSIILRKTPTSLGVFKTRLDNSITLCQRDSPAGEMELRLDFHPLLQHRGDGEIGYLVSFVKEGYKEILEHPLCQSFLHLKWQKIRKYYVARLAFYLLYVLVLTGWVMTGLASNCYNETHGQPVERTTGEPGAGSSDSCVNSTGIRGFFYHHPVVLEIEWYTLVLLTVLEGSRKATGVFTYHSARQFLGQPENIIEWSVILSVFATSFVYTGRTYTWQSHVGAFAVLCGWTNLMLMIGQLPMFGAYVAMFTSVQAQVFKLLLAYACLLVGFTASFCVIFPRSKSFSSPHTGLIKVLVMMTGELDFEELFFPGGSDENRVTSAATTTTSTTTTTTTAEETDASRYTDAGGSSTSWILLQVSAQLSFVLFLLFVTIVLMNLLVGIAVHDIKGLQKTAGLAKLVRQTKLICDVESALLLALLPNRLMKLVRWTTLVLPSPLRAVLTVRPLNPRENRLPRDVLAAAHRVARIGTSSNKRTSVWSGPIRRAITPSTTIDDHEELRLRSEIADLTKICEENGKLIRQLATALMADKREDVPRYYPLRTGL